jgi:cell division control protein 6
MENASVKQKIIKNMNTVVDNAVIINRRFLDDEQLIHSEQLQVLEEIFNANVRDYEIREISSHFAPILRNDHPMHLALWGKTGTGKTLTISYFLKLLSDMCQKRKIPVRIQHLDLSTPRPCFRALNDLACLLNVSKKYKKGISLEEIMHKIESALSDYRGYFILFIDEVDNVRTDKDNFLGFLIRRLPQAVAAKVILVFASNRINWADNLDPRIKSFLKMNELIFKPYDAVDLQHILKIRVKKALDPGSVAPGVIEKIAAMSCQEHGDARKAVVLLSSSAYIAEKTGSKITTDIVAQAAQEIERDKYVDMIRTAPIQLQAVMASVIRCIRKMRKTAVDTYTVYDAYKIFCSEAAVRCLAIRAFRDLINELDMYTFIRARVLSKGRYGRTREIVMDLPSELADRIYNTVLLNFQLKK